MASLTVRVPATTANLGPGFDCVGCALSLFNSYTFETAESGLRFTGCSPAFANEKNLLIRGFDAVCRELGQPRPGLVIDCLEEIPFSHGLGSSAALLCAGAAAANAFFASPLSKADLLRVCTPIEGHPDNLAPALFGGMTASMSEDGVPFTVSYAPHSSLRFVSLIPEFDLSTQKARSVLPEQVSRGDAVYNLSHTAVLLKAMEAGDTATIRAALKDRLHQPYRKVLIPDYGRLEAAARECGAIGFCISGAGPTLLCLTDSSEFVRAMQPFVQKLPHEWKIRELPIDFTGTRVSVDEFLHENRGARLTP